MLETLAETVARLRKQKSRGGGLFTCKMHGGKMAGARYTISVGESSGVAEVQEYCPPCWERFLNDVAWMVSWPYLATWG